MYQYSLGYYTSLFSRCIADSERSSDLTLRLSNIINYATLIIYQNICRGLFEKDKLLFSASICFQILRNSGEIHDTEWNLFMRGPGAVERQGIATDTLFDVLISNAEFDNYRNATKPTPGQYPSSDVGHYLRSRAKSKVHCGPELSGRWGRGSF